MLSLGPTTSPSHPQNPTSFKKAKKQNKIKTKQNTQTKWASYCQDISGNYSQSSLKTSFYQHHRGGGGGPQDLGFPSGPRGSAPPVGEGFHLPGPIHPPQERLRGQHAVKPLTFFSSVPQKGARAAGIRKPQAGEGDSGVEGRPTSRSSGTPTLLFVNSHRV